jgi:hypothetical protein
MEASMQYIYPAIIHKDSNGLWAEFPELPGRQASANTMDEFLTNAAEALACAPIESLSRGDDLPLHILCSQSTPREELAYPTLIRTNINLVKAAAPSRKH